MKRVPIYLNERQLAAIDFSIARTKRDKCLPEDLEMLLTNLQALVNEELRTFEDGEKHESTERD